jgi:RNA polymerase sigma-70 factor (ECF subfamily)
MPRFLDRARRISLDETNALVVGLEKQTPMPAVDRFSAMYDAALPVVYGFISLRVGGNRALAEDLTAEAFAAAVAEYRAGRPDVVTTSWLCTVAKRRLIDHWRRENVASRKVIPLTGRGLVFDSPDTGEREAVVQALATLSSEQRAALVLQHVEGYSVAEIAELIGRTTKATESLLGRARSAFRSAYSEVDDD